MRILTVFGVVCTALALAGCDTDQPLDASTIGGAGDTTVQIQATATVPDYGVWDWTEDVNGNGMLDIERDLDNDQYLDTGEDIDHDGQLDPGEDRNANGRLNFTEDFMSENGLLDRRPGDTGAGSCPACEDINLNCVLDSGEDKNGDGLLASEDVDCDGRLDSINEDTNRNGRFDFEDTIIPNSAIDSGIYCEAATDSSGSIVSFVQGLVPIPLGGEVLLYHPGNPTPEVVASVANAGDGLTPYDTRVFGPLPNKTATLVQGLCDGGTTPGASCTFDLPCAGGGECIHFQLPVRNGQHLPAGAPRLALGQNAFSQPHPRVLPDQTVEITNAALCTVDLGFGNPNLGTALPITVQTAPGDTISVRLLSKQPGTFNTIEQASQTVLSSSVSKNGVPLAPQGTPSAAIGQSVSFHVAVP